MLTGLLIVLAGVIAVCVGFPLSQKYHNLRGVLCALLVIGGILAIMTGVVMAIVPAFFRT